MAVDDLRVLAGFPEKLHRRTGEKGEPHHVVVKAVDVDAVEKLVGGMRLYKIAFAPVHEAEKHRAVDRPSVPGHPKIAIGFAEPPDMVVPQAVIFGEDDLDMIA